MPSIVEELTRAGKLVDDQLADRELVGSAGASAAYVLEHPKLPFVSWPDATIVRSATVSATGRVLYWYDRS